MDGELLTREQAAAYLNIPKSLLERWACSKERKIPYVKMGKIVRYKRQDLDKFIASCLKK